MIQPLPPHHRGTMTFSFLAWAIALLCIVAFIRTILRNASPHTKRTCQACNQTSPPHARYCRNCGKKL